MVLLHELAHVKRFDWLTQLFAGAAAAIYWFNPLAWFAARRMRIEREQACDDLVLRSGSKASDYADELLQIANAFGGRRWDNRAAIPMARRSSLESRLLSILTDGRERRSLKRWIVATAFVVMTGIVVPVAMLQAAENDNPPAEPDKGSDKKIESADTYRNWVTAATDTNTPFDEFALAQIAGDKPIAPSADEELVQAAIRQGLKNVRITRENGRIILQVDRWTVKADSAEVDQRTGKIRFRGKVVGPKELSFEGRPIKEATVRKHLSEIPSREFTVLELAVTTDELSWRRVNEFRSRYARLANELGFEHSSFIGVHKAATKGSASQARKSPPRTINAMGHPVAPRTAQQKTADQLQERLLAIAKRQMEEARRRVEVGAATEDDYLEAAYAYEVARDPDNKLRHAEVRVKLLESRHRGLQARRNVGTSTERDVEKAEIAKIQAELEYLRLKHAATRTTAARPDVRDSVTYWMSQALRYRDSALDQLRISYDAQAATLAEQQKKYVDQHPIITQSKRKLAQTAEQIRARIQRLHEAAVAPQRPSQKPGTKTERTAMLKQLRKLAGKEQWNVLAAVHQDPILLNLIGKLNAHEQSLQSLQNSFDTRHPNVLKEKGSLALVTEQLAKRVSAILKGMEIEISAMTEAQPRRFTVLGRVTSPGVMEMPNGVRQIPLLDAVARAGGFTRYANTSSIKIRRREGGKDKVYSVSAKKLAETPEQQFMVLPDDQITVTERVF